MYALSLGLCLLALLSKPMAASLPFVLLLLDWYPMNRLRRSTILSCALEKIPFLALAVSAAVLNLCAKWGHTVPYSVIPADLRLMTALHNLVGYLGRSLVPLGLSPLYEFPAGANPWGFGYVLCALAVLGATAVAVWRARSGDRIWLALWLWYLMVLSPTLGFVLPFRHAMADRYTYLPTLSLWMTVGLGFLWIWNRFGNGRAPAAGRIGLVLGFVVALTGYAYVTQQQIQVWKDSDALWSHVVAGSKPVPAIASFGLGKVLEQRGEFERANVQYQAARSREPNNPVFAAAVARGMIRTGETVAALEVAESILAKASNDPLVAAEAGRLLAMAGRTTEAIEVLERALRRDPYLHQAYPVLVLAYLATSDPQAAQRTYLRYIERGFSRDVRLEERLRVGRGAEPAAK